MISPDEMDASAGHTQASHLTAGLLAAAAIFAGIAALVTYPGRIGPAAIVIALVAAGLGGRSNRLTALAMATATGGFFFGMIIAVLLDRPIF